MSETSFAPERLVPGSEFLTTLVMAGGDTAALHDQYPQLTTRFVGEYTPQSGTPDSPGAPVPYSCKFSGYRPEAQDVIRTRGTFQVAQEADVFRLSFRSGSGGDIYQLGDVDRTTAQAFVRYGQTYTEVDLAITETPDPEGHKQAAATLESIVGLQETLTETRDYERDEIILLEGFVCRYESAVPDPRSSVGKAALRKQAALAQYNPEKTTKLVIQLPNRELVTVEPRSSSIHYQENLIPSVPATPSEGDFVQVLAKNTAINPINKDQGYALEPFAVQLQDPSFSRKQHDTLWRTAIQHQVDTFGEGQDGINNDLRELLSTAFYTIGSHARFNLTPAQKKTIAGRLEAAYVSDPDSIPAIISGLKDPTNDLLENAAEAVKEGFDAFTISQAEMAAAIEDTIVTRPEYNRQTSVHNTLCLINRLLPAEKRQEIALQAWERIQHESGSEDAIEQRIGAVRKISGDIFTPAAATLVSEMALWDKLRPSEALRVLAEAINCLPYHSNTTLAVSTALEVFGIYHDTYQKLRARLEQIDSTPDNRFSFTTIESAVQHGSAYCYSLARQQGIL